MSRGERSGKRDLTYSGWHRTLPSNCYMYDIDCLEVRGAGKIVAVIETKRTGWRRSPSTDLQMKILAQLADALNVPGLLVEYHPAESPRFPAESILSFEINDLQTTWRVRMTDTEYRAFIIGLPETARRFDFSEGN